MIEKIIQRCQDTVSSHSGVNNRSFKRIVVGGVLLSLMAACQTPQPSELGSNAAASEASASIEVRKSPNDAREYRYLTLPNEMRVLLVSDPDTDKAAAAMAVYRGSYHEPENRPGIAHFLEHMLFIQTEAYPEPGAFQKFVTANGGSSNAYTALDHTNYFFNIQPEAFPEALDRWGHFFIDPILSAEYSEREKNAVHSEYQMQIKDDGWRGYMVGKQALNPAHPATRFTIGSLDTLAGDIQADLISFFETEYSADQMGLVLISNVSLDELEEMVRPLFNQVVNNNIGPAYVTEPMYLEDQLPLRVENQTFKDGAHLTFAFPIPSTLPHYKKKPEQYFANLIGHEGTGSLYQYLSERGWVESLGAGVSAFDRATSVLNVGIELTPLGNDHREEITTALFSYIDLLKSSKPANWLYEEQAQVAELGFRFQEKSSPTGLVYRLAPQLDHYPPEDLLVAPYLMEEFDADLIETYFSYLTPENVVVEYTSPDVTGDQVEPWFKVPFAISPFEYEGGEADDLPFRLPVPNPFLPENLELVEAGGDPISETSSDGVSIWLDTDTQFGTPRSVLIAELATPGGLESPTDRAQAQLLKRLIQDSLSELVYPAYLAGLSYSIGISDAGFEVQVAGYSDKQSELLQAVLAALVNPSFSEDRFASLKASLIKDWANSTRERPYSQTFSALTDTLRSGRWPRQMLIDAIQDVELKGLYAWHTDKMATLGVTALLHGNVTNEDRDKMAQLLTDQLAVADQPIQPLRASARELPVAAINLEIPIDHNDSSLILHIQDDDEEFATRARSLLAAQMLQPEYFRQLRTEQQLGYVVSASARAIAERGGITFIVQSPSASSAAVQTATEEFLSSFAATPIEPANFEQQKSGLINQLLEKPKKLTDRTRRYWSDLVRDITTFDSREQLAEAVEALTIAELTEHLAELERRITSQRLLIFSRGQYEDIPTGAATLADPTSEFPG